MITALTPNSAKLIGKGGTPVTLLLNGCEMNVMLRRLWQSLKRGFLLTSLVYFLLVSSRCLQQSQNAVGFIEVFATITKRGQACNSAIPILATAAQSGQRIAELQA